MIDGPKTDVYLNRSFPLFHPNVTKISRGSDLTHVTSEYKLHLPEVQPITFHVYMNDDTKMLGYLRHEVFTPFDFYLGNVPNQEDTHPDTRLTRLKREWQHLGQDVSYHPNASFAFSVNGVFDDEEKFIQDNPEMDGGLSLIINFPTGAFRAENDDLFQFNHFYSVEYGPLSPIETGSFIGDDGEKVTIYGRNNGLDLLLPEPEGIKHLQDGDFISEHDKLTTVTGRFIRDQLTN